MASRSKLPVDTEDDSQQGNTSLDEVDDLKAMEILQSLMGAWASSDVYLFIS